MLVSIYLCWGWIFICDLNTSAGEHLECPPNVCVRPPCGGVYVCVFKAFGRANEIFMVAWWDWLLSKERADRVEQSTVRSEAARSLSLSLFLSLYKEMSGGRGHRQVRQSLSLLALSSRTPSTTEITVRKKELPNVPAAFALMF